MSVAVSAQLSSTQDLAPVSSPISYSKSVVLSSGTGAGKADRLFSDRRTLAASSTEDLDLAGALTDALGGPASMARVKGVIITAKATNVNNVVVGAASVNAWATLLNATGTLTLRPGASVALMAGAADATGYTVTAGTGDLLKIANSGAGSEVVYDVVIVGASA